MKFPISQAGLTYFTLQLMLQIPQFKEGER